MSCMLPGCRIANAEACGQDSAFRLMYQGKDRPWHDADAVHAVGSDKLRQWHVKRHCSAIHLLQSEP